MITTKNQSGFLLLATTIVVSAILLSMSVSFQLRHAATLLLAIKSLKSSQAYYASQACAQQALWRFSSEEDYAGDEQITLEEAGCSVLPLEVIEERGVLDDDIPLFRHALIKTEGRKDEFVQRLLIDAERTEASLSINEWRQVAGFGDTGQVGLLGWLGGFKDLWYWLKP